MSLRSRLSGVPVCVFSLPCLKLQRLFGMNVPKQNHAQKARCLGKVIKSPDRVNVAVHFQPKLSLQRFTLIFSWFTLKSQNQSVPPAVHSLIKE